MAPTTPPMTPQEQELELLLFALLARKYVQRADTRQKALGLQYTTAETGDLARTLALALSRDILPNLQHK